MTDRLTCSPANARLFRLWLDQRWGLAHWRSLDLGAPDQSWTTPVMGPDGQPAARPHWSAGLPDRVVTDAADVDVVTLREVARFPVAIRQAQGLRMVLTAGSQRKVEKALEAAGPEAGYCFDYGSQEAVIEVPDRVVPLDRWEDG